MGEGVVAMSEAGALALTRLVSMSKYIFNNPGCSVIEVAAHFNRTPEQVRKDVELLVEAGFGDLLPGRTLELDYDAYVEEGSLTLRTVLGLDRTPTITEDDLLLMLYGLHALSPALTDREKSVLPSATAKLYALADVAAGGADASGGRIDHPELDVISLVASADKLSVIRQAIETGELLELEYMRGDGTRSTRLVQPSSLTYERDGWLLGGLCLKVGERRSFRLDRMVKLKPANEIPTALEQDEFSSAKSDGSSETGSVVTLFLDKSAAWVTHESVARVTHETKEQIEAVFDAWDREWMRTEVLLLAQHVVGSDPHHLMQETGEFAVAALQVWDSVRSSVGGSTND